MFHVIGRDSGKNVVKHDDGRLERLTDAELAALEGKPYVEGLPEVTAEIDSLKKEIEDLKSAHADEVTKLTAELAQAKADGEAKQVANDSLKKEIEDLKKAAKAAK